MQSVLSENQQCKMSTEEDNQRPRTIGEVYFLRAYTYHYLVALYGGVPIITKPYKLG